MNPFGVDPGWYEAYWLRDRPTTTLWPQLGRLLAAAQRALSDLRAAGAVPPHALRRCAGSCE